MHLRQCVVRLPHSVRSTSLSLSNKAASFFFATRLCTVHSVVNRRCSILQVLQGAFFARSPADIDDGFSFSSAVIPHTEVVLRDGAVVLLLHCSRRIHVYTLRGVFVGLSLSLALAIPRKRNLSPALAHEKRNVKVNVLHGDHTCGAVCAKKSDDCCC